MQTNQSEQELLTQFLSYMETLIIDKYEYEIEEKEIWSHPKQITEILEKAESNEIFLKALLLNGSEALNGYKLTSEEKAAIISGDLKWIEEQTGPLNECQRFWFDMRLMAENW